MPFPQWQPGMRITATRMNEGRMQLIEQLTDQSAASTTYVNSQITFTPDASARYAYWLFVSYSAAEAADLKWRWDAPGAAFGSFTQSRHTDATGTFNTPASVIFRRPGNSTDRLAGGGGTDTSNFFSAYDSGTFDTDSTSAAITMQFAQNTAAAVATILRGSNTQTRLLYQRIA